MHSHILDIAEFVIDLFVEVVEELSQFLFGLYWALELHLS